MDAKAYLKQVKYCDTQIDRKLEERQRLWELATKVTSTLRSDAASGGSDQDKLGGAMAKIADLDREIDKDIDGFVELKKEIGAVIDKIPNSDFVKILDKRYFAYKTWEKIACEMNYTYQWVCVLHGRALQAVENILKNQKN